MYLRKFIDFSFRILEWLSIFSMVTFVILIFVQVVTRRLGISVPWTDELARYVLIYATFIGTALATKRGLHLGVDYFVNKMPRKIQKAVNYSMYACGVFFQGVLLIFGTRLAILSINTVSPILQWSTGLIFLVIPITAGLTILVLTQQMFSKKVVRGE